MEAAPEPIPKKRRRPSSSSSNPFTGITRSKSQIYLHCNRTFQHSEYHAHLRSSSSGFLCRTQMSEERPGRRTRLRVCNSHRNYVDDDRACILTKKRTRRIFSPAPIGLYACNSEETKRFEKGSERCEDEFSCDAEKFDSTNSASPFDKEDNMKKSDMGGSFKEQTMKGVGVNLIVVKEDGGKSGGDGEILNAVGDLSEERVLATPPYAEILHCGYETEHGLQKPSIGTTQKSEACVVKINKGNDSNLVTKSLLNSLSPGRIFRNPGSFSYRRLLPYLMDMAEDNCSGLERAKCPNADDQQILKDKLKIDSSSTEDCYATDTENLPQGIPILINSISDGVDSNLNSNLTSVEHTSDLSMVSGSEKDLCVGVSSPTSLVDGCYSKPAVNEGNKKIGSGGSREDNTSIDLNPGLLLTVGNSHFDECHNDTKPVDGGETRRTDAEFSCAQDANDTIQDSSLVTEKHQMCEDNEIGPLSANIIPTETEGMKSFDIEDPQKATSPNHTSTSSSDTETHGNTCNPGKKGSHNGDISEEFSNANEEYINIKPPDAESFYIPEGSKYMGNRVTGALQSAVQVVENPSNGNMDRNKSSVSKTGTDSSPKSKLGLNPCSRLKLFKTPSSFSYRRLLPYLLSITEDNSGAFGNINCPKLMKSLKEPSSSNSGLHATAIEKVNGKNSCMECDSDNAHSQQMATLTAVNHASNSNQPSPLSPESNTEVPIPSGSQEEQEAIEVASDKDEQSNAPDIVSSIDGSGGTTPLCSVVSLKSLSGDGLNLISYELSLDNDPKPAEADNLSQNLSKHEASDLLAASAYGFRKGILKRNPRGCRGVCSCLSCASFRLHAERAFEFSKNQMQDAEELALDLIKELSHLRNMLQKYVLSSDSHHNQVKEACRQASEAEALAKSRLNQMNYDLNVHCRIPCDQRPRVQFANNVEERKYSIG